METSAWIALAGVVLTNGGILLTMITRHARSEERVNERIRTLEVDLSRGRERFVGFDRKLDLLASHVNAIHLQVARISERLGVPERRHATDPGLDFDQDSGS